MAENNFEKVATPKPLTLSFERHMVELDLENIIPLKILSKEIRKSRKFQQIATSIREVGIIEPLVIAKESASSNRYILLDGHMRLEVLKELGHTQATCLISTDDEAFTYNKYISRLTPIQEHRMILKMVQNGVSEEKIARALNVNVSVIIQKRSLLNGICPEAIELLKDKVVASGVFMHLKKMKPSRQIETATLMIDTNAFTVPYARALLASTPADQLVNSHKPRARTSLSLENQSRMQKELTRLEREYKLLKDERGHKNMVLQFAKNYLVRLLDNAQIIRFLHQNYPDILEEFQKIAEMTSLSTMNPGANTSSRAEENR